MEKFKLKSVCVVLFGSMLATSALMASVSRPSWKLNLDQGNGSVEFTAIGRPAALKIHGKGPAPQGYFTTDGAHFEGLVHFKMDSLVTGLATRDHHMKEKYLEIEKFPEATLQISSLKFPEPLSTANFKWSNIPFEGPLTLHGKTLPVHGTVSLERAGDQMLVESRFGLKISDYAIEIPSFAGITVANEVQVEVHAQSPWIAMAGKEK